MGENVIREANQKADEIIHRANLRGDDLIRDANDLLQQANDRAEEIINEANDKKLTEEREYERVRLEVTRFKSDVLNLYRSHVESLSRLPEYQCKQPEEETEIEQTTDEHVSDDVPQAAQEPAETVSDEQVVPAEDSVEESSEDFWAQDETKLKLDPPPADMRPEDTDYDAFQGVKFSE